MIIFGINRLGVFRGAISYTKMKLSRNFDMLKYLQPFKREVPTLADHDVLERRT